jgi:hypothetical protein
VAVHPVDVGFEIELEGEIANLVALENGASKSKEGRPSVAQHFLITGAW